MGVVAGLLAGFRASVSSAAVAPQVRGTWITTTGYTSSTSDIYNAATTDATFSTLKSIGINTVYMDIWRNGYTYFHSPTNAAITGYQEDPGMGSRDMLAAAVLQARLNQQSIFGWFQYGLMAGYGNPGGSTTVSGYMESKGWLLQDSSGNYTDASNGYSWMNPLVPQVQTYLANMLLDAVKNYRLQGIQFDDHMGWPIEFGYDAYTENAYKAATGKTVPSNYNDPSFTAWRAQAVTTCIENIISTVKAADPSLIISDSPSVYPFSYNNYCENWPQWESLGLFNEYVPQVYYNTSSSFTTNWNATVSNMSSTSMFAGGIAINYGSGYNPYSTVVQPSINTVNATTGIKGEVFWYSDGVLNEAASLQTYYNVSGQGQANRPDVSPSLLIAPFVGTNTGSSVWQITVTDRALYDLVYANGPTWATQTTSIALSPGTYTFNISSATQVDLLEDGPITSTTPFAGQWNSSIGGNWGMGANWSSTAIPDGAGATASFLNSPGLTAAGNINLDSNRTVGHLIFDNINTYTITADGGTLTIDNSGNGSTGVPSITVNSGSHIIAAPVTLAAGGVTITTAASSSLTVSGNINGSGGIIKSGIGTLTLSGSDSYTGITNISAGTLAIAATGIVNLSSVSIGSTGTLTLLPAANHGNHSVLVTSSLSFVGTAQSPQGVLDLSSNDLVITGGNLNTINSAILSGLTNGTGILSSTAAADSNHLTTLGVIQNNQSGVALYGSAAGQTLFDGLSPNPAAVLVKFTYYGDTNLDGQVDGSDYSRIDNGYLNHLTGWLNGDFNYDGQVDGSDYTLMDNAFNNQGASLTAALATTQIGEPNTTEVPEPTAIFLISLTAITTLRRRTLRRRRRNVTHRASPPDGGQSATTL
jgi:autotransporter-associated beta strand protein